MQTSQILNHLDTVDPFKELFDYINRNTYIRQFVDKAEINHTLLDAISRGEHDHPIFDDPTCYLHLLTLIENKKISFEVGMTVYAYLLALMQFTEKQPLRIEDQDVKLLRPIKILTLSKDGKLTLEGNKYLKSIFQRLTKEKYSINYQALEDFVLNLPPTEQWILQIPHSYSPKRIELNDVDNIFIALIANIPFLYDEEKSNTQRECWFPSVSLIQYILKQISPSPLKMKFCYGQVSVKTLRKLHAGHVHPVSIYGLDVKSNPKNADAYRCGPFAMWWHDIGHVYWGTKLGKKGRDFIFDEFILKLESLIQIANVNHDEGVVKRLNMAIDKAADFDLTPIEDYDNNTVGRYLSRAFGRLTQSIYPFCGRGEDGQQIEFQKIGEPVEDRLYFLLCKMYHELPQGEIRNQWGSIFYFIQTGEFYRQTKVINAIDHVACVAAMKPCSIFYYLSYSSIDWEKLSKKISHINDGDTLWSTLKSEYELESLMCRDHFIAFPPYVPITEEKIDGLKQLIKEKLDEEKTMRQNFNRAKYSRI